MADGLELLQNLVFLGVAVLLVLELEPLVLQDGGGFLDGRQLEPGAHLEDALEMLPVAIELLHAGRRQGSQPDLVDHVGVEPPLEALLRVLGFDLRHSRFNLPDFERQLFRLQLVHQFLHLHQLLLNRLNLFLIFFLFLADTTRQILHLLIIVGKLFFDFADFGIIYTRRC